MFNRQATPKRLLVKPNESTVRFWKALSTLYGFSLVEEESNREAYSMHRLVAVFN